MWWWVRSCITRPPTRLVRVLAPAGQWPPCWRRRRRRALLEVRGGVLALFCSAKGPERGSSLSDNALEGLSACSRPKGGGGLPVASVGQRETKHRQSPGTALDRRPGLRTTLRTCSSSGAGGASREARQRSRTRSAQRQTGSHRVATAPRFRPHNCRPAALTGRPGQLPRCFGPSDTPSDQPPADRLAPAPCCYDPMRPDEATRLSTATYPLA